MSIIKLLMVTPGPTRLYAGNCRPERLGKPQDLAVGHLLSQIQQKPTVGFFDATHQSAELVQKTRLFPGISPNDVRSGLALRKVGEFGRFFAVIEKLIKRDFQSARQFLERFDGRNSMAIFDAGDIATKQSSALFDVPLRKLFFFAQRAKTVAYDHVAIVPQCYSACKGKS